MVVVILGHRPDHWAGCDSTFLHDFADLVDAQSVESHSSSQAWQYGSGLCQRGDAPPALFGTGQGVYDGLEERLDAARS